MEDLIGGRVLAWVGGAAVLLGIAFLFAIGVASGWIGEGARTVLGALVSAGLLAGGVWLHGRRGRTDAAVAAVACGLSGLFVTITVAAQVYDLVPSLAGTALATVVGALAMALAVRWESRGIAGLGILGGLCAPVLAGSDIDGGSVTILFVALSAAAGVLMRQRWDWLAMSAVAIATPQWVLYLFDGASLATALPVLVAFGALGTVVAVGNDIRARTERIRLSSAFLLTLNAIVTATAGWFALALLDAPTVGKLWLAGLAIAYALVGLAGPHVRGISRDLGLLSLTLAVLTADVAFALTVDGPFLAVGWTMTAVAFAALLRHTRRDSGAEELVGCGLGGHIAIALVSACSVDDPIAVLDGDAPLTAAGATAIAALAAGCVVSARFAGARSTGWRYGLDGLGLASVALLTALALDGPALALIWAAEAAALTWIAHRRGDRVAAVGAFAFLAATGMHLFVVDVPPDLLAGSADFGGLLALAAFTAVALAASRLLPAILLPEEPSLAAFPLTTVGVAAGAYLAALALDGELVVVALAVAGAVLALASRRFGDKVLGAGSLSLLALGVLHLALDEAPPESLVTGLDDPLATAAATMVVVAAALVAARELASLQPGLREIVTGGAALGALYVASGLVVSPFDGGSGVDSMVASAHQEGQMVLSVFWGLVGVSAVAVGLRRDHFALRAAALTLLSVTVVKVFLFDLATLTSVYRAVSFIGLGLLLLVGAFVWQRLRPRPLRDMREMPAALR